MTGALDEVVCPPYDIITEEERLRLLGRSPFNVVRLELPNGRYHEAAKLLDEWKSNGALAWEEAPGALRVPHDLHISRGGAPPDTGGDRGARTRTAGTRHPSARADHSESQKRPARADPGHAGQHVTHLVPVLRARPDRGAGRSGLTVIAIALRPIASAQDDEGTLHEIWPIFHPEAHEQMARIIGARPLLVADGHHRYETALLYQAEQGSANPPPAPGLARPAMTLCSPWSSSFPKSTSRYWPSIGWCRAYPAVSTSLARSSRFELAHTAIEGPALLAEMVSAGALAVLQSSGNWLAKPRPQGRWLTTTSTRAGSTPHWDTAPS